jgi:NadR type nicotinamide-nucleotide adenylyltransferase
MVDRDRCTVPISATELRRNLWRNWEFLPAPVARALVKRIALLGGESSGKTALASRLAEELHTTWAPEYGRELWEAKGGALAYEDLLLIAREQIRREQMLIERARGFLFCDTSPLTTLFYSLEMFGQADQELLLAATRAYAVVVLCAPDFAFVQDGTRRDDAFRERQHHWYVTQLAVRGISYVTARGPLDDRCLFMRELLD